MLKHKLKHQYTNTTRG